MVPVALSIMRSAPAALRCAVAAVIFAAGMAWAFVGEAHAAGWQATPAASVVNCPAHQHMRTPAIPGIGTAPDRAPACAALCSVSESVKISAPLAVTPGVDGVKLAITALSPDTPIQTAQRIVDNAIWRGEGSPPIYLTAVRFLI